MRKKKLLKHNIGLLGDRVNYKYPDNRVNMEKVFQEAWDARNRPRPGIDGGHALLQGLHIASHKEAEEFDGPDMDYDRSSDMQDNQRVFVYSITKRENRIAATLMQWLGTNCGWSFLLDCLKKGGYEVLDTDAAHRKHEVAWEKRQRDHLREQEHRRKADARKEKERIAAINRMRTMNKAFFVKAGRTIPIPEAPDEH